MLQLCLFFTFWCDGNSNVQTADSAVRATVHHAILMGAHALVYICSMYWCWSSMHCMCADSVRLLTEYDYYAVLIGLLYKATPEVASMDLQVLLRLRPYPTRGHQLLSAD